MQRAVPLLALAAHAAATYMDCGSAHVCGILVLETGDGSGAYSHDYVSVHGLWPETGNYGSSACVAPSSSTSDPASIYTCYDNPASSGGLAPLAFEQHEWENHGVCAAVADAADFFTQVCDLSAPPLQTLSADKSAGGYDLSSYATSLRNAGYPIYSLDSENSQIFISACAGSDGRWVLANTTDFSSRCGSSGPSPGPSPSPSPSPTQRCVHSQHGPPCSSDSDCGFPGCVRCAHSGFCTDIPLTDEAKTKAK